VALIKPVPAVVNRIGDPGNTKITVPKIGHARRKPALAGLLVTDRSQKESTRKRSPKPSIVLSSSSGATASGLPSRPVSAGSTNADHQPSAAGSASSREFAERMA